MKLSLGMKLRSGSWGGGKQFGHTLARYLQDRGVEVSFDLKSPGLDIILMAEPDARLKISAYSHRGILKYLLWRNHSCIVVHRINNTSEARNDEAKAYNKFRINANKVADHTVFISKWVHARYVEAGFSSPYYSIILNGGDTRLWQRKQQSEHTAKLRLVTHHWSRHPNKGFDVYKKLDEMLESSHWSRRVSFTYIGRLPDGFQFEASRYLESLSGRALVEELQNHDVYLTASQNEAGGMHHIEGALCGLPLLYRESGALPEYCSGFGVSFTAENFEQKLQEMVETYDHWADRMKYYPHTAERMCEQYYDLFVELLDRRDEILARRRLQRRPRALLQALTPEFHPRRMARKTLQWLSKRFGSKN